MGKRIYVVIIYAVLALGCSKDDSDSMAAVPKTELKPVFYFDSSVLTFPAFNVEISTGKDTFVVNETVNLSLIIEGNVDPITNIVWEFDDETEILGTTASKLLVNTGLQNITARVTDEQGRVVVATTLINVVAQDQTTIPVFFGLKKGDINDDLFINLSDKDLVEDYLAGQNSFTDEQRFAADINLDDVVDEMDINLFLQIINDTWPMYISHTSAYPGQVVTILLPELLIASNEISVVLSSGGNVIGLSRPMPGYLTFIVPFQSSFINDGKLKNESVDISITSNDAVIATFDFVIEAPIASTSPPGEYLNAQLDNFVSEISLGALDITDLVNSLDLTLSEKEQLIDWFSGLNADALDGGSKIKQLVNSLDEDSLRLMESLVKAHQLDNGISTAKPLHSPVLSIDSEMSPMSETGFASAKMFTAEESCALPATLSTLRLATRTSIRNKELVAPVVDAMESICNVMGTASVFFPPAATLAGMCYEAESSASLIVDTIDVLSLFLPTLNPDLTVETSLPSISPAIGNTSTNSETQLTVKASAKNTEACNSGIPFLTKKIAQMIVRSHSKNYVADETSMMQKKYKNEGSESAFSITNTMESLQKYATGVIVSALDQALTPLKDELCSIVNVPGEVEFEIPSCEITNHIIAGVAGSNDLYDKTTGIYKSRDISDCISGNVTFGAQWNLINDIVSSGDVIFAQSCNLIYNFTITSIIDDYSYGSPLYKKFVHPLYPGTVDEYKFFCSQHKLVDQGPEEPQLAVYDYPIIGSSEQYSETWEIDLNNCVNGKCDTKIIFGGDVDQGYFFEPSSRTMFFTGEQPEKSWYLQNNFTDVTEYEKLTWLYNAVISEDGLSMSGSFIETSSIRWTFDGSTATCTDIFSVTGSVQ